MDAFESFLAEHADEKICTVTPGGNHGDTLIHMGMVKKLEEAGCDYQCVNLEEVYGRNRLVGVKYLVNIAAWRLGVDRGLSLLDIPRDASLILFEGGGYMNDIWYGLVLLGQVLRRHEQPVAVAPQSYWFEETDFMGLFRDGRPVTLFCREHYSLDLLTRMEGPPNVRLLASGDTALYLRRRDLEEYIAPSNGAYDLVCLRKDRESIVPRDLRREIIEGSAAPLVGDISKKGRLEDFVSAVANADRIFTDRLHVAILAHTLRKEATLYDNRYHKNRGVYEYSLRKNRKIRFVELG